MKQANLFENSPFTWIVGVEDTCVIPSTDFPMNSLDELELTGNRSNWKEDFDTLRRLGAKAVRYGADWPLVHVAPGKFNWGSLDERLNYAHSIGLCVIADLVHYGTPVWLKDSFIDPGYPDAIAEFSGRFAARYKGVVDYITPFNEPLTTASFCGLRGIWPPGLTDWNGWASITVAVAKGVQASIKAIRKANPDAKIVHVEASAIYYTKEKNLVSEVDKYRMLGFLPTDLILGKSSLNGTSGKWLMSHGVPETDIAELSEHPSNIDYMGVNYYPDLTPRELFSNETGTHQTAENLWTDGLEDVLREFANRYNLPLLVTETSIEGDEELRASWVNDSIVAIAGLRGEGIDVRGWTWWPVFDFVDWSYASGGRNIEEFEVPNEIVKERENDSSIKSYLRKMGLYQLRVEGSTIPRRIRSRAADAYSQVAAFRTPEDFHLSENRKNHDEN